jgi:hypothetical protein
MQRCVKIAKQSVNNFRRFKILNKYHLAMYLCEASGFTVVTNEGNVQTGSLS